MQEEKKMTRIEREIAYGDAITTAMRTHGAVGASKMMREFALSELYYLLVYVLGRSDVQNDWLYDRCVEVQIAPDGYLDLWSREHYKALALDTPVPTPDGWKNHGDLRPGDSVFGPDGKPCKVVAVTPVFRDATCYKVQFDGASPVTCSGNHLWAVGKKSKRRIPGSRSKRFSRDYFVWDTEKILAHGFEEDNRLSIRITAPIDLPETVLPIDPYVLGVWLGDGSKNDARITVGLDCADETEALLSSTGINVSRAKHSNAVSLNIGNGVRGKKGSSDFMNALRGMGLVNNKHIPEQYLRASISQRTELLRGLMDTDGHANTRGSAVFVNTNETLSRGFYELAVSLGFKAKFGEYRAKLNGIDKGVCYRIQFQAGVDPVPFHLSAKAARCKQRTSRSSAHFIRNVELVETVPVSCIQVDREDGLYLVGRDMVVTHNSTILSFALTIQDILKNPEITCGIFSCTRPLAKRLLRQIKFEFEANARLKTLFPDILYADPRKEAPKWSEDDGIIVKRKTNPAAATVEAWGLVDGQPTGKHFSLMVYDDVVTRESVTTPDMIRKVTEAWELSRNLSAHGGRTRYIGTRYHMNDTYHVMMERDAAKPRIYPATIDGTPDGEPVFLDRETLATKRREMGPFTFAAQMLQNPTADDAQGFDRAWIRHTRLQSTDGMNIYIVVDPASEKKKDSDYTVFMVVGLGSDENYYIIDMVRDRMNLTERAKKLMELHRMYRPKAVGYEKYGMMADVEFARYLQQQENYRFDITELGGTMPKNDRIRRLVPLFEQGRVYLPMSLHYVDYQGRSSDLVRDFVDHEYISFPVSRHDDMMDCLARIADPDLGAVFPKVSNTQNFKRNRNRSAMVA